MFYSPSFQVCPQVLFPILLNVDVAPMFETLPALRQSYAQPSLAPKCCLYFTCDGAFTKEKGRGGWNDASVAQTIAAVSSRVSGKAFISQETHLLHSSPGSLTRGHFPPGPQAREIVSFYSSGRGTRNS